MLQLKFGIVCARKLHLFYLYLSLVITTGLYPKFSAHGYFQGIGSIHFFSVNFLS